MRRRQARAVVVRALHDVAVDARRLQAVQLRSMKVPLLQGRSTVQPVRSGVRISQGPGRVQLVRHVATTVPAETHPLWGKANRTVLVVTSAAPVAVRVLSLELVLNTLAIRRVPYQRQNRPDAFHEQRPLTRFCVVEGGLGGTVLILRQHEANSAERTCTQ